MYILYIRRPFCVVGHMKHVRYTPPPPPYTTIGWCMGCVSRMDIHACSRVDCGVVDYVGLLHCVSHSTPPLLTDSVVRVAMLQYAKGANFILL